MSVRLAIDHETIAAFCRKWKVQELAIFGSAIRDDFGPDSDVDVLVELQPDHELDLFDWVDMIEELKGIFGRNVDLVDKAAIRNPFRRHNILAQHEVVYEAV